MIDSRFFKVKKTSIHITLSRDLINPTHHPIGILYEDLDLFIFETSDGIFNEILK